MISGFETGGADCESAQIAVDAAGRPRIAFYDARQQDLCYLEGSGASWTFTRVDTVGDVGRYVGLALDADGAPQLAYFDVTNSTLKWAR
ncbi:MAG: hypothetical protein IPJ65_19715 [Archangiaceae bacterium]|nr:hypothetical protein [Archangiaceae bacterium]